MIVQHVHASGKKKQDTFRRQQLQHSTPKAGSMATKPSAKMHSKSPAKHLSASTPHHRHQHSSSTVTTVRSLHSTPPVHHTTPRSMTHPCHVGGDTSPAVTLSDEIRLRELFSILKGYEHMNKQKELLHRILPKTKCP